jgi:hypothetical protein
MKSDDKEKYILAGSTERRWLVQIFVTGVVSVRYDRLRRKPRK